MRFVVGIDEAGRGPLAGPVSVGVCAIPRNFSDRIASIFPKLRDSKKLTEKKRAEFLVKMRELKKSGDINFAVALVSAKVIDEKGITYAIKSGIEGCLKRLSLDPEDCEVLLDGGLKAPGEFKNQKTIIKGDETEASISLASIAAKVTRDLHMVKEALSHPGYGFEVHKGYGTASHGTEIQKRGLSPIHRQTFCGKYLQK